MQGHNVPVVCTVKAVYAFAAKESGDLTLRKDGGWWKGTLVHNNAYGSFPSNFVQRISTLERDSGNDRQESPQPSTRPLIRQQHVHSRQTSSDSARFSKRKPVSSEESKPTPSTPATTTPKTQRPKNPQAILPDSNFEDQIFPNIAPVGTTTPQFQRVAPHFGPRKNSNDSQRSAQSRISQQPIKKLSQETDSIKVEKHGTPKLSKQSITSLTTSPSFPGAYPSGSPTSSPTQVEYQMEVTNRAIYNPNYAEQKRQQQHLKTTSDAEANRATMLHPSVPTSKGSSTLAVSDRQLNNRYSMLNLVPDLVNRQRSEVPIHDAPRKASLPSNHAHGQSAGPHVFPATQSATNLLNEQMVLDEFGLPKAQDHHQFGQRNSEDSSQMHLQPGMMPRSATEYYSQNFGPQIHPLHSGGPPPSNNQSSNNVHGSSSLAYLQQLHQQQGHRHSFANIQQPFNHISNPSVGKSELSLENIAKHNRSQRSLAASKVTPGQETRHSGSKSQVNLRLEGSVPFNPYDHEPYQHQQQLQNCHLDNYDPMNRMTATRALSSNIVIPQSRPRPHAPRLHDAGGHATQGESNLTSPTARMCFSPDTPHSYATTTTSIPESDMTSPVSTGTTMSRTSVQDGTGFCEQRRKSEAMVRPKHIPTAAFPMRRFSGDTKHLLASVTTATATALPVTAMLTSSSSSSLDPDAANIDMSAYTAKKPKTTLIRAFKQILNPRKVAEKDAIKYKNEHFAWVEMQKSLMRVSSPPPTIGSTFFNAPILIDSISADDNAEAAGPVDEYRTVDPFEVLNKSHAMRDSVPTGNTLDYKAGAFEQVDKVARNVNQRGPHMTPQLLSQKYLTRPYSKSSLFKLRVLFVWVSENIRLEGGSTRDVSGGRYKLGPAGEHLAAVAAAAKYAMNGSNGNASASAASSPNTRPTALAPPPAVFMPGIDEYARGFLQEDMPELAQQVLTSRTCKTGEGFANLFAEMALAAGIEDVGVIKGYVRGPMDVFTTTDVPPPNHAWNVVRIDGTYRFIDCCLASPYHPAHYPNRPSGVSSFYFLTSPMDLVLSHFPTSMTYQFIAPTIPPQVFLRLPFVRPAFFDYGLRLVDFTKRTRLEIKNDQAIEVVIRIDGGRSSSGRSRSRSGSGSGGDSGSGGSSVPSDSQGMFCDECLGRGCGEGIELRAEVEAMTSEGKVIRKRGLAQVMIWNPYSEQLQQLQQASSGAATLMTMGTLAPAGGMATIQGTSSAVVSKAYQGHHCTGIRIAKIKAVLPADTVIGSNGVRKGVVHIYAGRKVENAPSDATPYSLALSLPILHTGTMSKTPFNFVLPHFSPYEFYVKAPQSELLYYPHTYTFCVVSLAAQAQGAAASSAAVAEADMYVGGSTNNSMSSTGIGTMSSNFKRSNPASTLSPRHVKSGSMAPLPMYRSVQPSTTTPSLRSPPQSSIMSTSISTTNYREAGGHHPYQHQAYPSLASTSSLSMSGSANVPSSVTLSSLGNGNGTCGIPRPERLMLRTQTNRLYKLVYDPLRHCHQAKIEIKERGIWECVRMDDGGKSRVGREGTGGVVIASWRFVVQFQSIGNAPILKQKVFKITASHKFMVVIQFLRKELGYQASDPLFLYVNSAFSPAPDEIVNNLFKCCNSNGKLIINYCTSPAWG
ncbi:cytokinesis protein 3 [Podila humilis]|nr:cytokinesis protein 3 [Podila humilis]